MKDCVLVCVIAVSVLCLTAGCVGGCALPWDHSWVAEMEINDIDLRAYDDGSYEGRFSYNNFTYIVESLVVSHRYESIAVIANRDSERAQAAEEVLDRVLAQQTLLVDAVSGATNTSKALLKAVENGFSR